MGSLQRGPEVQAMLKPKMMELRISLTGHLYSWSKLKTSSFKGKMSSLAQPQTISVHRLNKLKLLFMLGIHRIFGPNPLGPKDTMLSKITFLIFSLIWNSYIFSLNYFTKIQTCYFNCSKSSSLLECWLPNSFLSFSLFFSRYSAN